MLKKVSVIFIIILAIGTVGVWASPNYNLKTLPPLIIMGINKKDAEELYKNQKDFCLINQDCVIQKDCYCCDSDKAINKVNYNNVVCSQNNVCLAICEPRKLLCENNRCLLK